MSAHAYTEDQLVDQPAIGLFAELGWQVAMHHPHLSFAPKLRTLTPCPSPKRRAGRRTLTPVPSPRGRGGRCDAGGRCGGGGMADKEVDTKEALGAGLASGIGWFHGETRAR